MVILYGKSETDIGFLDFMLNTATDQFALTKQKKRMNKKNQSNRLLNVCYMLFQVTN